MEKIMSKQRTKKSRSYSVVKGGAVTTPMAPPGVPNENIQITTGENESNKEGK